MNYQIMMDEELDKIKQLNKKPTLLLHACCAPCSSYVLEYLSSYFDITILYYNPKEEFTKRYNELDKLIQEMKLDKNVKLVEIGYRNEDFEDVIDGMRDEPEGGSRCYRCYLLRLCEAAKYASSHNFSYFTTTLSISPYKNAKWLNEIGEDLSGKYDVKYLYADFKKRNGYKRSIELSNIYNLYRQDYCGCIYSKRDVKSSKNT
mgnify:FL=1